MKQWDHLVSMPIAGSEAAVHAMKELFDDSECEAALLIRLGYLEEGRACIPVGHET